MLVLLCYYNVSIITTTLVYYSWISKAMALTEHILLYITETKLRILQAFLDLWTPDLWTFVLTKFVSWAKRLEPAYCILIYWFQDPKSTLHSLGAGDNWAKGSELALFITNLQNFNFMHCSPGSHHIHKSINACS